MHPHLKKALWLFVFVAVAALVARHTGWYNGYWFTDVILHLVSGVMFGYLWLWAVKDSVFSSRLVLVLSLISFAALGGVLWEFWEYWGYLFKPGFSRFYVPELADTLEDILCGMIGAAGLAMVKWRQWRFLKAR